MHSFDCVTNRHVDRREARAPAPVHGSVGGPWSVHCLLHRKQIIPPRRQHQRN